MKKFFCLLMLTSILYAQEFENISDYLNLIDNYPLTIGVVGQSKNGEIEILKDPERIIAAAQQTNRNVGILHQDKYWIWVNDPVQFPNGKIGVFGRVITKSSFKDAAGCAVVPYCKNGSIAFNCNFRHATRSWELEIPRGISEEGEDPENSAKREVMEELGLVVKNIEFLGKVPPDTGMSSAFVFVYMAEIEEFINANPEDSEAIAERVFLSKNEILNGLHKGFIFINIKGKKTKVFFRDPFFTYALVQMNIRDLFFLK